LRPRGATKLDYEVELAVVIGREARYVEAAGALSHVAGYCIVNDVSERAFQWSTIASASSGT
jgi:2-keto-4-pentenoate hydratase/2-oxohepta-3-ene-1,7-dioic acid hydratase in catechol pathway